MGAITIVSIKDIAGQCGVSIATVSKALNNHTDISEATRKRVCSTAKEMGYLPNSQARALKTNKTFNIGVLFVDKAGKGFTHSYFAPVLNGFKVEAEKMGYDVTFISRQIGKNAMSYYEHCKYRRVDGIMVACMDFYDSEVIELLNGDIPLVAVDFESERHYSVTSDNSIGMRTLVKYVGSKGHRKIACIYGDSSQITSIRLNAFLDTMKEQGLPVVPDYIRQGKYHNAETARSIVREMLSFSEPPTCILMPDDFSAMVAKGTIEEMGLKVPNDISITGYDGSYISEVMQPPLTTIRQNTVGIGKKAAEILVKLIKKEEIFAENKRIIIEGKLIEGGTVKDLNI